MDPEVSGTPERTFTQAELDRIVQERLARDRQARVVSEPRVYDLYSPHSFFQDAITLAKGGQDPRHQGAGERMARYGVELVHEIEARSAEGKRAERIFRNAVRVEDPKEHEQRFRAQMREVRALTTGGGTTVTAGTSASVFVSPYFLLDEWAMFRGIGRSFTDQCHVLPIPDYGMQMYLPFFSSTSGAGQQTEGSAVTETDPASAFGNNVVVTVSGQITETQQMRDRGFTGAGSIDTIIHRQLQQQLEEKLDLYVLNTVIAAAGIVTGASSLTANSWKEVYQDIAKGREGITDTAGVRLRPTHLFTTADLYSGLTDIMGSDGRPMQTPTFTPGFPLVQGADDGRNGSDPIPKWARFTGTVLPGGVLWFTDDNIPASGSNAELIVTSADQSITVLETPDPVFSVFPQTVANQLEVVLNLRSYVCAIARHASGTQVISGNAYPTTLK